MGYLEWKRKGGTRSEQELMPRPLPECTPKHPQATTLCGTVWLGPVVCSDLGGNYSVSHKPARCLLQTVVQTGRAATLSGIAQRSTHLLGLDQNLIVFFGRKKSMYFPFHCDPLLFTSHLFLSSFVKRVPAVCFRPATPADSHHGDVIKAFCRSSFCRWRHLRQSPELLWTAISFGSPLGCPVCGRMVPGPG